MIKLYLLDTISNSRGQLFPLLKPFLKKETFTDEERKQLYGVSQTDFTIVDDLLECDFAVVPNTWNYYVEGGSVTNISKRIKQCEKPVWSFCSGDFGVAIPNLINCYVFRCNGNQSKLSNFHKGAPVFINDPLLKHFGQKDVVLRDYHQKPIIGFCGQANSSAINSFKELSRTIFRNCSFALGLRKQLPQPVFSTSKLRATILKTFVRNKAITTNFIFRRKYRAGVKTPLEKEKTTQEFYDNMLQSDYVVCVRGGGNFSVRFYEALSMGRIPIFINTDCLLPLSTKIDWKKHVVWVEYQERHLVVEKVIAFHEKLNSESFRNLQKANRKLWKESLTLGGFFKKTANEI